MHQLFVLFGVGWAVAAYALYSIIASFVKSRREARLAREWKCEDPPVQKNKKILGIDQIQRSFAADGVKRFPPDLIKRTEDVDSNTFKHSILGMENYFTAEPKNIQALLATQFADFDLGHVRRGNFFPLLGNGIFSQDGKAWEHSRAMMRPQFAREQVSNLDLEEQHVQNMMRALPTAADNWTSQVDLSTLFFRLTLDSATEFLFGESVDSQVAALDTTSEKAAAGELNEIAFARAFDVGQMGLAKRARFADKYWLSTSAEFRKACSECHEFIDHFVRLALSKELREKVLEKGEGGGNSKYIFLEELAQQTRDPIELRSQLLHILLAGRDTTASLLGWLFYLLARDPERYSKLRERIVSEFGTYESSGPEEITFSKLKSCTMLQQYLNETLRLYPVVPINGRMANKDTTLPTGGGKDGKSKIFVRKGQQVDYSVHVMHRRKDLWGQDADEFRPERWDGRRPGWEFLPFNGGPRICIGQQFALTEASYVVVRMLQRFDRMENLETDNVVRHNLTLTNCSANGVQVRLRAA